MTAPPRRPARRSLARAVASLALALAACGRGSPSSRDLPPAARPIAAEPVPGVPSVAGSPRPPGALPPPAASELPGVPPGDPATPVREICLVQMDCAGRGRLDRAGFVQLESGRGRSCQDAFSSPRRCEALLTGEVDEPGASALCGRIRLEARAPLEGGRPRESAQKALRELVARPAPCAGAPGRVNYQTWCDDYRADGTLRKRTYFASLAGGGERLHLVELEADGKTVASEFTDCDSGHH